jgi:hypothetical protein
MSGMVSVVDSYYRYISGQMGVLNAQVMVNGALVAQPMWLPLAWRVDRFWSKVAVSGPNDCWPWLGLLDRKGYGRTQVVTPFGIVRSAHRWAFFLCTGIRPGSAHVLHSCDNPPCCNPRHHFLGDQVANNKDRHSKGRTARGAQLPHTADLSRSDVIQIKHLCRKHVQEPWDKATTQAAIARRFGVGRYVVYSISSGKRRVV